LDEQHIELLMQSVDSWPPIVVWGDDLIVVDGHHRVQAARRLGRCSVLATRFPGSPEEVFIEAVRRNVSHGLPLSLADRRRAARRVLARNPEWSNRRIASVCGLSDKTVGCLRPAGSAVIVGVERRVGLDGRVRPAQSGQVRERVKQALAENPRGSLRAIAIVAGVSPETVRSVRANLLASERAPDAGGHFKVTPRKETPTRPVLSVFAPVEESAEPAEPPGPCVDWVSDRALTASDDGARFVRWFASTDLRDEWHDYLWSVPLGRVYEVVDEARRRAAAWTSFASLLESRTR
jgi:ParB-like chromosome segregation protein Spo0J